MTTDGTTVSLLQSELLFLFALYVPDRGAAFVLAVTNLHLARFRWYRERVIFLRLFSTDAAAANRFDVDFARLRFTMALQHGGK